MTGDQARGLIAVLVLALGTAAAVIFRHRLGADFWPLDRSAVGPNLVAAAVQGGLVLVLAALFYPPARRAAHRFVDGKVDRLHRAVAELHDRHDQHASRIEQIAARVEALHDRLDEK